MFIFPKSYLARMAVSLSYIFWRTRLDGMSKIDVLIEGKSEDVSVCSRRLSLVARLLEEWVKDRKLTGAAICVARNSVILMHQAFGRMSVGEDAKPAQRDTIWLIASVTKPITCCGLLLLIERGKLMLDDKVIDFVPEFDQNGKGNVHIRHLLTHTSGLPDMLPNNVELRLKRASFKKFIEHICKCDLLFPPGTDVSYQSMGIAILAEIVERIEGVSFRNFLAREFFVPLGMEDTWLGLGKLSKDRVAESHISEEKARILHWNTDWWRDFGAPWGGLHSTVKDIAIFLQMILNEGSYGGKRIFSPTTVKLMIKDQISLFPEIPHSKKVKDRWGLGWCLKSSSTSMPFGDLVSSRTFGHIGATGTIAWADPELDLLCCLFTNEPYEFTGSMLAETSNTVTASVTDLR